MTKSKSQTIPNSSKRTIDFGQDRIKKIKRFRAIMGTMDVEYKNLDQVVNHLVDKALEAEKV